MTPAELLHRLTLDSDEGVRAHANRVRRRIDRHESNLAREVCRLLEPWVAAGLVTRDGDGFTLTFAGQRLVATMTEPEPEAVAA